MGIWTIAFLVLIYLMVCLALIFVILIQSGKGGGLSSLGQGASGMGDALGSTSAERTLTKFTTTTAILFMVLAITISLLGSKRDKNREAALLFKNAEATKAAAVPAAGETPGAPPAGEPAADSNASLPPVAPGAQLNDLLTNEPAPAAPAPAAEVPAAAPATEAPAAPAPAAEAPPAAAPAPAEPAPAAPAAAPPAPAPAVEAPAKPAEPAPAPAPEAPKPAEPAPAAPPAEAPKAEPTAKPAATAVPDALKYEILGINPPKA